MGIFQDIERLITEHGSAAILRERLALASEQYSALEKKVVELEAKNSKLQSENSKLREQASNLSSLATQSNNTSGYVCDHCGSSNLKRTGSRPDPTFGRLGVKEAVFLCAECCKESAFQQKT